MTAPRNLKTVAGCATRVTVSITAPEGADTELTAYVRAGGESLAANISGNEITFPPLEAGEHMYEVRCGGKTIAHGHLFVRQTAYPVGATDVVDWELDADLTITDAAQINLTLQPGPSGPAGADGQPGPAGADGQPGQPGTPGNLRPARCEQRAPYLFETWYEALDYGYGLLELQSGETSALPRGGGCSSIRAGSCLGRNFDWLYDNTPTAVVHTPAHAGRHATLGVSGAVSGLTAELLQSGEFTRAVGLLPFCIVDGLNDAGLAVSTNVVPHNDTSGIGDNSTVNPAVLRRARLSSVMLPRYILDNFSTAREAAAFIRDYVEVYHPAALIAQGYEQHYLLADGTDTLILEFIQGSTRVLEATHGSVDGTAAPWITNFHRWGSELDTMHHVSTPGSHSPGTTPSAESGLTPHAAGLERNNIIADWYFAAVTPVGMASVLDRVKFTRAYTDQGAANWYSDFVGGELTVDSSPNDYAGTMAAARAAYQERDRDNPQTWQTVHAAVYNLQALTLSLRTQEGDTDFAFRMPDNYSKPARCLRKLHTAGSSSYGYFVWAILGPNIFRAGTLKKISIKSRASGNPAGEKYLAIYQQGPDDGSDPRTWPLVACSTNKSGQSANKFADWLFKDCELREGYPLAIRACAAIPAQGEAWTIDDANRLGATTAPRPDGDTASGMWNNNTSHNDHLPEMSIEVLEEAWTAVAELEARVAALEARQS